MASTTDSADASPTASCPTAPAYHTVKTPREPTILPCIISRQTPTFIPSTTALPTVSSDTAVSRSGRGRQASASSLVPVAPPGFAASPGPALKSALRLRSTMQTPTDSDVGFPGWGDILSSCCSAADATTSSAGSFATAHGTPYSAAQCTPYSTPFGTPHNFFGGGLVAHMDRSLCPSFGTPCGASLGTPCQTTPRSFTTVAFSESRQTPKPPKGSTGPPASAQFLKDVMHRAQEGHGTPSVASSSSESDTQVPASSSSPGKVGGEQHPLRITPTRIWETPTDDGIETLIISVPEEDDGNTAAVECQNELTIDNDEDDEDAMECENESFVVKWRRKVASVDGIVAQRKVQAKKRASSLSNMDYVAKENEAELERQVSDETQIKDHVCSQDEKSVEVVVWHAQSNESHDDCPPHSELPAVATANSLRDFDADVQPFQDDTRGEEWSEEDTMAPFEASKVRFAHAAPEIHEYEAFPWDEIDDWWPPIDPFDEVQEFVGADESDSDDDSVTRCVVADPDQLFIPLITNKREIGPSTFEASSSCSLPEFCMCAANNCRPPSSLEQSGLFVSAMPTRVQNSSFFGRSEHVIALDGDWSARHRGKVSCRGALEADECVPPRAEERTTRASACLLTSGGHDLWRLRLDPASLMSQNSDDSLYLTTARSTATENGASPLWSSNDSVLVEGVQFPDGCRNRDRSAAGGIRMTTEPTATSFPLMPRSPPHNAVHENDVSFDDNDRARDSSFELMPPPPPRGAACSNAAVNSFAIFLKESHSVSRRENSGQEFSSEKLLSRESSIGDDAPMLSLMQTATAPGTCGSTSSSPRQPDDLTGAPAKLPLTLLPLTAEACGAVPSSFGSVPVPQLSFSNASHDEGENGDSQPHQYEAQPILFPSIGSTSSRRSRCESPPCREEQKQTTTTTTTSSESAATEASPKTEDATGCGNSSFFPPSSVRQAQATESSRSSSALSSNVQDFQTSASSSAGFTLGHMSTLASSLGTVDSLLVNNSEGGGSSASGPPNADDVGALSADAGGHSDSHTPSETDSAVQQENTSAVVAGHPPDSIRFLPFSLQPPQLLIPKPPSSVPPFPAPPARHGTVMSEVANCDIDLAADLMICSDLYQSGNTNVNVTKFHRPRLAGSLRFCEPEASIKSCDTRSPLSQSEMFGASFRAATALFGEQHPTGEGGCRALQLYGGLSPPHSAVMSGTTVVPSLGLSNSLTLGGSYVSSSTPPHHPYEILALKFRPPQDDAISCVSTESPTPSATPLSSELSTPIRRGLPTSASTDLTPISTDMQSPSVHLLEYERISKNTSTMRRGDTPQNKNFSWSRESDSFVKSSHYIHQHIRSSATVCSHEMDATAEAEETPTPPRSLDRSPPRHGAATTCGGAAEGLPLSIPALRTSRGATAFPPLTIPSPTEDEVLQQAPAFGQLPAFSPLPCAVGPSPSSPKSFRVSMVADDTGVSFRRVRSHSASSVGSSRSPKSPAPGMGQPTFGLPRNP